MTLKGYHQDLHTLHVNTLPNRAYYIPFSNEEDARRDVRTRSDRFTLLSGEWRFRYFDSVQALPEDFLSEDQPAVDPLPLVPANSITGIFLRLSSFKRRSTVLTRSRPSSI